MNASQVKDAGDVVQGGGELHFEDSVPWQDSDDAPSKVARISPRRPSWEDLLTADPKGGKLVRSISNAQLILCNDPEWRDAFGADVRAQRAFLLRRPPYAEDDDAYPRDVADHMLVLQGPQGKGKSTALEILAGGEQYFGDNLPPLKNKDAYLYLAGLWIVEFGELEALQRNELATIKAFLTSRSDKFRVPYGTRTESHPRRVVFAGTCNDPHFLKDSTGDRRFWPVACGEIRLDELRRDRDMLWAEAQERFRACERWHLEGEHARAASSVQAAHYVGDPWEELIERWIESGQSGKSAWTTCDVLGGPLGIDPGRQTKADQQRVASVLDRLGYQRGSQRRDPASPGKRMRCWVKKPGGKEEQA